MATEEGRRSQPPRATAPRMRRLGGRLRRWRISAAPEKRRGKSWRLQARVSRGQRRGRTPWRWALRNRVRERFIDAGSKTRGGDLLERDRRSRRRPVICGRRTSAWASTGSPPTAGKLRAADWGPHFLHFRRTEYPYGIFVPEGPPKKNKRRERFPEISGLRPGRPAGVGVVKSMSQVPFRTGASIEGSLPSRAIAQGPSLRSSRSRESRHEPRSVRRRRDAPGVQRARLVLNEDGLIGGTESRATRWTSPRRTPRRSAWWTPSLGLEHLHLGGYCDGEQAAMGGSGYGFTFATTLCGLRFLVHELHRQRAPARKIQRRHQPAGGEDARPSPGRCHIRRRRRDVHHRPQHVPHAQHHRLLPGVQARADPTMCVLESVFMGKRFSLKGDPGHRGRAPRRRGRHRQRRRDEHAGHHRRDRRRGLHLHAADPRRAPAEEAQRRRATCSSQRPAPYMAGPTSATPTRDGRDDHRYGVFDYEWSTPATVALLVSCFFAVLVNRCPTPRRAARRFSACRSRSSGTSRRGLVFFFGWVISARPPSRRRQHHGVLRAERLGHDRRQPRGDQAAAHQLRVGKQPLEQGAIDTTKAPDARGKEGERGTPGDACASRPRPQAAPPPTPGIY